MTAIKRVFSPSTPELRLLPIGDPDARQGARWRGRIIRTAIYGRSAVAAAVHFGLPRAVADLWLNALFIVVAAMGALVIARIRRSVAAAIESSAQSAAVRSCAGCPGRPLPASGTCWRWRTSRS